MNVTRLALAAVAATIWDALYGCSSTACSWRLNSRCPRVYRPDPDGQAYLPLMFAGIFVAMIAVAAIYAKGYEGGSGMAEGLRFGILLGLFVAFAFSGVDYAVLNIGRKLAVMAAAAGVRRVARRRASSSVLFTSRLPRSPR